MRPRGGLPDDGSSAFLLERKKGGRNKNRCSKKRTISFGLPSWKKVVLHGLMMMTVLDLTVICMRIIKKNIRFHIKWDEIIQWNNQKFREIKVWVSFFTDENVGYCILEVSWFYFWTDIRRTKQAQYFLQNRLSLPSDLCQARWTDL